MTTTESRPTADDPGTPGQSAGSRWARQPSAPAQSDPPTAEQPTLPQQTVPPAVVRNEQCDRCQAPVAHDQRYCIACGSHQRRPNDPVLRYFATSREARKAAAAPKVVNDKKTIPVPAAALLIALLPVAAGIGILVGRSGNNTDEALLKALQNRGTATAVAGTTGDTTAAAAETEDAAADKKDAADEPRTSGTVDGIEVTDEQAPLIDAGNGRNVHQLDGYKPTAKDVKESKDALEQIEKKKGDDYVDQQSNLPDVIVVP